MVKKRMTLVPPGSVIPEAKRKKTAMSSYGPEELLDYIPIVKDVEPPDPVFFCSRQPYLPDASMLHGRMHVIAWENGLNGVDDPAIEMIVQGLQVYIKRILSALFMRRSGFEMNGKSVSTIGVSVPNPWLRNTAKLQSLGKIEWPLDVEEDYPGCTEPTPVTDDPEQKAAYYTACANQPPQPKLPLTLFDFVEALQVNPSIIPMHPAYSVTMEKCFAKMSHPGHAELDIVI